MLVQGRGTSENDCCCELVEAEEGMFIFAAAVAEKLPENCFGCLSIHAPYINIYMLAHTGPDSKCGVGSS